LVKTADLEEDTLKCFFIHFTSIIIKIMEPRPRRDRGPLFLRNGELLGHSPIHNLTVYYDINCKFWPNNVTISDLEWGYILCKVVTYFKNNLYFYIVMFSSDLQLISSFKVPQGANNLILCTLDTIHKLFLWQD
jgi:hypothetical protein